MEEKSNTLFGGPDGVVETLLFFSRNTQFLLWKAFLELLNASVAVPEGEERLLTLTKAVLFFYNLDVLQIVHCLFFFLFNFDSNTESWMSVQPYLVNPSKYWLENNILCICSDYLEFSNDFKNGL